MQARPDTIQVAFQYRGGNMRPTDGSCQDVKGKRRHRNSEVQANSLESHEPVSYASNCADV